MPRRKKTTEPKVTTENASATPANEDGAVISADEERRSDSIDSDSSATARTVKNPKKAGRRKASETAAKKVPGTRKQSKAKHQESSAEQPETVPDGEKPVEAPAAVEAAAEETSAPRTNDAVQVDIPQKESPAAEEQAQPAAEQGSADSASEEKPQKQSGKKAKSVPKKAAAVRKRTTQKAAVPNLNPVLILQFQGNETDTAELIDAAKTDFKAQHKRTPITDLKLYLKPEEHAAYYVVNGNYNGKIAY